MRKKIILPVILAFLLLSSAPAWAINKNAGTSGAQFLKIGAGARPTAMGDSFVGVADDINSVYFNPAGLSNLERPVLTAMHTQWFQGMDYNFGAFAYPTNYGAFAISAITLQTTNLEKRGLDESQTGTFDALDSAYTISYSRNLGPLLSVGVNARYLSQQIDTSSAKTWSGDVGVFKRFAEQKFCVGAAIRHFGQEIKFEDESDPQPLTLDLGASKTFFKERFTLAADLKQSRDNDIQYGTGAEFRQPLSKDLRFAYRAGYNSLTTDVEGTSGITMGAGLSFRQFDFDFAWIPFGDLGNTFRYAATIRF